MAKLKPLIQSNQLKTDCLTQLAKTKQAFNVEYDEILDSLSIYFNPDDQIMVAHYVDDHIALLYLADTLEIVGLQIEDFTLDFLPAHENVARIWRLSDTGEQISDMRDIILVAKKRLPKVAQEVAQATKDVLGEPGLELAAALEETAA